MNFNLFLQRTHELKVAALGGFEAQLKLAPSERIKTLVIPKNKEEYRRAAVLSLFYPDSKGNTKILLTLRATYNGTHSAQVSFPGGKYDLKDEKLEKTALRECFEEVGIPPNDITIVKELTDVFIPPSKFRVTPFLGYTNIKPEFKTNHEVSELIEVSVKDLLDDKLVAFKNIETSYSKNTQIPYFKLNNQVVWGATAMIISEIKELLKSL